MAFNSEHPQKQCQEMLFYLSWHSLACRNHLMREKWQKCGHWYKDQRWACNYSVSSLEKDYDGFDHFWQRVWICVRYTDWGVESDTKTRSRTGPQGGHYISFDCVVSYGLDVPKWVASWTDANELEAVEWCAITGEEGWTVSKAAGGGRKFKWPAERTIFKLWPWPQMGMEGASSNRKKMLMPH